MVDVRRASIAASVASSGRAGVALPEAPGVFVSKDGVQVAPNPYSTAGLIAITNGYDSRGFLEFDRRDGSLPRTGSINMQDDSGVRHSIRNADDVATQTVSASGRLKTGEFLEFDGPNVVEGAACLKDGLVASGAGGLILSCQSGRWKIAQGGGGTGILGTLSPLKGMMLSCTVDPYGRNTVSGGLDDNGNIQLRAGVSYCTNVLSCRQNGFGRTNLRVEINQTGIIGTLTEPNSDVGNGGSDYVTKCGASFPMR